MDGRDWITQHHLESILRAQCRRIYFLSSASHYRDSNQSLGQLITDALLVCRHPSTKVLVDQTPWYLRGGFYTLLVLMARFHRYRILQCLPQCIIPFVRQRYVVALSPTATIRKGCSLLRVPLIEFVHGLCLGHSDLANYQDGGRSSVYVCFDAISQKTLRTLSGNAVVKCRYPTKRTVNQPKNSKTAVIFLQYGYLIDHKYSRFTNQHFLTKYALQFCRYLLAEGWIVLAKPHPSYFSRYQNCRHHKSEMYLLESAGIEVLARNVGIFDLNYELGITMSSKSVVESAIAGIPSIAFCPSLQPGQSNADFYSGLRQQFIFTPKTETFEQILDNIRNCRTKDSLDSILNLNQGSTIYELLSNITEFSEIKHYSS